MKIVVAIDSLKGSLESKEAGNAIKKGILNILPNTDVIVKSLADGGEGTSTALIEQLDAKVVSVEVCGPLEDKVCAEYGIVEKTKTAIMEMASASGIILVGEDKRPLDTTTYGVGEMIKDAINKGCRDFIIGIGGSATNDGGLGMLSALGYQFLDKNGEEVGITTKDLKNIFEINNDNVIKELKECTFNIACDVNNPLCGTNGATYIYGKQKGVAKNMMPKLDEYMLNYANVTKNYFGFDFINYEGAGAAGGLGFAFLSYLNATLKSGVDLVLDTINMESIIADADFVFTGEGRLDEQTAMGKAPIGIAKIAKKHDVKVIALAGAVSSGATKCNEEGIDAYFPIIQGVCTIDKAMQKDNAINNMVKTTEQIIRLINVLSK